MRAVNRAGGAVARPAVALVNATRGIDGLTLVGWHRIGRGGDGLSTPLADFRRHLDVLEQWGARVLPLEEAVGLLATDSLPRRAVALTFDDGYASVLEHAWPELRARGWPATLFAVSGYLDGRRRFPWDIAAEDVASTVVADAGALRCAADEGLDIGSHTVTHRWLPHLTPADVDRELVGSRHHLEDLLGREVTTFAYPMGGWSHQVREHIARAGYRIAVTVDRGRNHRAHDPLSLRRAFAFERPTDFHRQLDGAFDWMRPLEQWRTRSGPR
jgi:peptidoglycan/xylan/chitin deacetylase (PgdA/CDA1 family)